MTNDPRNDTREPATVGAARARLVAERMKHERLERLANGLSYYAIDLGKEIEMQAEIDRAFASLGVAAAAVERAEYELRRARLVASGCP